jgi:hypothetical protein
MTSVEHGSRRHCFGAEPAAGRNALARQRQHRAAGGQLREAQTLNAECGRRRCRDVASQIVGRASRRAYEQHASTWHDRAHELARTRQPLVGGRGDDDAKRGHVSL